MNKLKTKLKRIRNIKILFLLLILICINKSFAQQIDRIYNIQEIKFDIHGGGSLGAFPYNFNLYIDIKSKEAILELYEEIDSSTGEKISEGEYVIDELTKDDLHEILNLISMLNFPYDYNEIGGGG